MFWTSILSLSDKIIGFLYINLDIHWLHIRYLSIPSFQHYLSYLMTKPNEMGCATSKDSDQAEQPPILIESSLSAQWVAKDPSFFHADSDDSDQTGRMPRLQADLSLHWAHMPFCWFCHEADHFDKSLLLFNIQFKVH